MKRLILIFTMLFALPCLAQNSTLFKQLTDQYSEKEGFSASMLTSDMFDLYVKKKNIDDSSPLYGALKNIESIVVISQSNLQPGVSGLESNNSENTSETEIHKTILDYYKNTLLPCRYLLSSF